MILNGSDPQAIAQAVARLQAGELVGLPTETVYGLAANAEDEAAVAKIFSAKGRPADHPLIVHVSSVDSVQHFASEVPACDFYAATFERLFRTLVHHDVRAVEVACEACGDAECRFELRW